MHALQNTNDPYLPIQNHGCDSGATLVLLASAETISVSSIVIRLHVVSSPARVVDVLQIGLSRFRNVETAKSVVRVVIDTPTNSCNRVAFVLLVPWNGDVGLEGLSEFV